MVDHHQSPPLDTVTCRICCEDIRKGAKVCTNCGNPQNWAAHLFRWKEVLTAILALAPLYSAAISLRHLALDEVPLPQIRAVVLSCSDTVKVQVAVANVGKASGVIRSPLLRLLGEADAARTFGLDIDVKEGRPGGSRVLKAGETVELNLVRRISGAEAPPIKIPGEWTLRVPYSGFEGENGFTEARVEVCTVR